MMNTPSWLTGHTMEELVSWDAFQFMGVAPQIKLDRMQLERHLMRINQWVHPDRVAHLDAADRLVATELCAKANGHFKQLNDFRLRAECLLDLHQGPTARDDRRTPPGLLEQIFIYNEKIDAAIPELEECLEEAETLVEQRQSAICACFERDPLPLSNIRLHLNALKYEDNILKRIESLEEEYA